MSTKQTPLEQMKKQHKDKETLVDRVLEVIDRAGEEKDELKARLLAASNKKLMRLLEAAHELKEKFGSREKASETIASAMGKAKDKDYIAKLAKLTPPRLMAMYHAVERKLAKKPA